jgi:hypothetical protein
MFGTIRKVKNKTIGPIRAFLVIMIPSINLLLDPSDVIFSFQIMKYSVGGEGAG